MRVCIEINALLFCPFALSPPFFHKFSCGQGESIKVHHICYNSVQARSFNYTMLFHSSSFGKFFNFLHVFFALSL